MTREFLSPGSAKSEQEHRVDICIAGRWMYEREYIVACEGNLSVRLDNERVLTTPTCMNKGMLAPEDLVIIDLEGRQVAGEPAAISQRRPRGIVIHRAQKQRPKRRLADGLVHDHAIDDPAEPGESVDESPKRPAVREDKTLNLVTQTVSARIALRDHFPTPHVNKA